MPEAKQGPKPEWRCLTVLVASVTGLLAGIATATALILWAVP